MSTHLTFRTCSTTLRTEESKAAIVKMMFTTALSLAAFFFLVQIPDCHGQTEPNEFVDPPPMGINAYYDDNVAYEEGSILEIKWRANFTKMTLEMWQQPLKKDLTGGPHRNIGN